VRCVTGRDRYLIERRRSARDQGLVAVGTRADLLVVNGTPLADVTGLRWREALALVIKDGLSDAWALQPARRDGS
jgi:hypothetical protein